MEQVFLSEEMTCDIMRALKACGFRATFQRIADIASLMLDTHEETGLWIEADDAVRRWCKDWQ